MKKDIFYFPHFCNARSDRRIRRVLKDFKHEGYSVYYQILEVLREQDEFKYPLLDCDLLVDDLKTTDIIINSIISNYELFENDGVFFWSNDLIESLQPYLKMKAQRIEASKKGVEARRKKREQRALELSTDNRSVTDRLPTDQPTANQSKVKESKVNKSKVKESKGKESKDNLLFFCLRDFNNTLQKTFIEDFEHEYEGTIYSVKRKHGFSAEELQNQIEEFFLNKCSFEFESANHVKSSFMKFCEFNKGNTLKNKNNRLESKFTAEEPNPEWKNLAFVDVKEEERSEFVKWKKQNR